MGEYIWARGAVGTIEYGTAALSNLAYIATRQKDASELISQLLAASETYSWPTLAGNNICVKMDLKYCVVTENRYHDYLPVYRLAWTPGDGQPREVYSDDFMDIVAEIMKKWW